jgi:hypothetical protein
VVGWQHLLGVALYLEGVGEGEEDQMSNVQGQEPGKTSTGFNGKERGVPSSSLKEAMERGRASGRGISVEQEGDSSYDRITEAAPEKGIFTLVGGYTDEEGVLHNEVELRAMTGHEEDLLGNRSIPMIQRMDNIMGNCVLRLGKLTDKADILKAVRHMPSGTRTHLLICQRVAGHWKTVKDVYEMEVRCPSRSSCGKIGYYKLNLLDLETFEPEDPSNLLFKTKLPYSEDEIEWHVMTGVEDRIMQAVADEGIGGETSALSYAILLRLREWNGESVELGARDFLTGGKKPKLKLSKKAKELLLRVKNLSTGDRDHLRGEFDDNEPGVEVDIEIECQHCGLEFIARLDVAQESFFFPRATSRRSNRKSSI